MLLYIAWVNPIPDSEHPTSDDLFFEGWQLLGTHVCIYYAKSADFCSGFANQTIITKETVMHITN